MKIIIFILLIICTTHIANSQCKYSISGEISDAETKDIITNANIFITELQQSAICNNQGFFEFDSICTGHYNLIITHAGCEPVKMHIVIKNTNWHQAITINHAVSELAGIIVKSNQKQQHGYQQLKGTALESTKGLSLGESLQKINGVTSLQTGTTIFKPIINGLHSSRILILNNGVRQEGQQWGAEHAPEIDAYAANKITVIKGASTMQYGADAIGGIVLVEPKLLTKDTNLSSEVNLAVFSNNRMGAINFDIEKSSKKVQGLAWRINSTLKKGGNAQTPSYWLANTGLQEANANAMLGILNQKYQTELYYSFFSNQIGIFSGAHIGNVTDLNNAIKNLYPPDAIKNEPFSYSINRPMQQVQHHLLKWKQTQFYKKGTYIQSIIAAQYNWRREFDKKKFASSSTAPQLDLGIATVTADIIYQHASFKKWNGKIGLQQLYQNNFYSYRLFIPNYQLINTGIFVIEKLEKQKYNLEFGARFDNKYMYAIHQNNEAYYNNKSFRNASGNIGISTNALKNLNFNAMLSATWRAPNMNELFSNGLHHGAARIEKGDSNLISEKAYAATINAIYKSEKLMIDVNAYYKSINDFIYLQPSYPSQLTIRGAFPLFIFKQTNAQLYGTDISSTYHFSHHFNADVKMSILYAYNKTDAQWLINMPSNRYEVTGSYLFADTKVWKNNYIKLNGKYVAQQNRIPTIGNIEILQPDSTITLESDYLAPPKAYFLLSTEVGTQVEWHHKNIMITMVANNLLNTTYREYLNAFRYFSDEMGRNISLKIKIPLN